jgi:hypothetical protein
MDKTSPKNFRLSRNSSLSNSNFSKKTSLGGTQASSPTRKRLAKSTSKFGSKKFFGKKSPSKAKLSTSKRSIRGKSPAKKAKKAVKKAKASTKKLEPASFGPLKMDDGDNPITNHNPMEINHPDQEPVIASKPCNSLWNKPDLAKDNPMLRVPQHKGGMRDDMSMTNCSFNS